MKWVGDESLVFGLGSGFRGALLDAQWVAHWIRDLAFSGE